MWVSSIEALTRLEILANQAKLVNRLHPDDLSAWWAQTLRKNGYESQGEIVHRVVLILDEHEPRIRIRFSFIDDQTRWEPVRVLGSFYLRAVWADATWSLVGDY